MATSSAGMLGSYIRSRWAIMSCLSSQQDRAGAIRTLSASALLFIFQELDQHPLMEIRNGRCSSVPVAHMRTSELPL